MPVTLVKNLPHSRLALWHIRENLEELERLVLWGNHRDDLRVKPNKHWLSSRVLLQFLLNGEDFEIQKDEYGKPQLNIPGMSISLSHSGDYAAAMVSRGGSVGVDLERVSERIKRIAPRFVGESEKRWIPPGDEIRFYYLLWAAKEALYKQYGKREIDFREHLEIDPVILGETGELSGRIVKNGFRSESRMIYRFLNGYILVYTI